MEFVIGQRITAYGHDFRCTTEHTTAAELEPLRYSYDFLARHDWARSGQPLAQSEVP